jgi:acyl-CoA thioester hydrolase
MPFPTAYEDYKLLIREHHLDSYGHINNATYLEILEEARWELITKRGYGWKNVHESGLGPVVLECNLKFKKEVRLREEVSIRTRFNFFKDKIGEMEQEIVKLNGEIACQAKFTFGYFDLHTRKLVTPPDKWLKAMGVSITNI